MTPILPPSAQKDSLHDVIYVMDGTSRTQACLHFCPQFVVDKDQSVSHLATPKSTPC